MWWEKIAYAGGGQFNDEMVQQVQQNMSNQAQHIVPKIVNQTVVEGGGIWPPIIAALITVAGGVITAVLVRRRGKQDK